MIGRKIARCGRSHGTRRAIGIRSARGILARCADRAVIVADGARRQSSVACEAQIAIRRCIVFCGRGAAGCRRSRGACQAICISNASTVRARGADRAVIISGSALN